MNVSSKLRICCAADVHIHDDESLQDAIAILKHAITTHCPDLLICLGDTFDNGTLFQKYGLRLRDECQKLHSHWLFCYGNHDGEGFDDGYMAFRNVFQTAQQAIDIKGYRIVCFADMCNTSGGEEFSLRNTIPGAIVCCHGNQPQHHIEKLAKQGARLIVNGHKHFAHIQRSKHKQCEQITLPPLRFGGMNGESAGCAIIDVEGARVDFQWVESKLPAFPLNRKIWTDSNNDIMPGQPRDRHFEGTPDRWLICPPLKVGDREWKGGPSLLQYCVANELLWEKSYGASWVDNSPITLHSMKTANT